MVIRWCSRQIINYIYIDDIEFKYENGIPEVMIADLILISLRMERKKRETKEDLSDPNGGLPDKLARMHGIAYTSIDPKRGST